MARIFDGIVVWSGAPTLLAVVGADAGIAQAAVLSRSYLTANVTRAIPALTAYGAKMGRSLVLAGLLAAAELVPIAERIAACRDPRDDKFLEPAVSGHADLIVTGDRDLLTLNPFRQIPIVTPAIFVQGVPR